MAERPVFLPLNNENGKLIDEVTVEFKWYPGMAVSQKRKNINALHAAAKEKKDIYPILEISTKSDSTIGRALSAFNLVIKTRERGTISLESAFQGSKVFEQGGPYIDLYGKEGRSIKKDSRLKESGKLLKFSFENTDWKLEPKTAFYDWLYMTAVYAESNLHAEMLSYKGFTDIEFNPKKSINCQARSCALYVALFKRDLLDAALKTKQQFLEILEKYTDLNSKIQSPQQLEFF